LQQLLKIRIVLAMQLGCELGTIVLETEVVNQLLMLLLLLHQLLVEKAFLPGLGLRSSRTVDKVRGCVVYRPLEAQNRSSFAAAAAALLLLLQASSGILSESALRCVGLEGAQF
jgi:hypothetical protein